MQKKEETTLEEVPRQSSKPEKKTEYTENRHYEDSDPVTVIWKSWGTTGLPPDKVTYFDRHAFTGGVGRRIPYSTAKRWQALGHGILIFDADATDEDFIRATGHKPLEEEKFAMLLRATPPDKIAALLGTDALDKITALVKK